MLCLPGVSDGLPAAASAEAEWRRCLVSPGPPRPQLLSPALADTSSTVSEDT